MIEIRNLSCHYGTRRILHDISLHVKEHLCILGANGSGKSTLAKALCQLVDYEGTVLFDGLTCKETTLARRVTYIPAKLEAYDPFISVEAFVLLGRFVHKERYSDYSERDRDIVAHCLSELDVKHLGTQSLQTLSSGEQQLVLIAQALAQQSRMIIFDEPTANLDPANAKKVATIIKALKASHEIVLISHDLQFASYFDAPILFIEAGRGVMYEEPQRFFNPQVLQHHYGVAFEGMAVRYD